MPTISAAHATSGSRCTKTASVRGLDGAGPEAHGRPWRSACTARHAGPAHAVQTFYGLIVIGTFVLTCLSQLSGRTA